MSNNIENKDQNSEEDNEREEEDIELIKICKFIIID